MIFLYGIMLLRERFKSKRADNHTETHNEGATDNSMYQELGLRNRDPESNYQALRMNTRKRINNETKIEDEAGYENIDKVREKDKDYVNL